jgi:hypothetical protein
LFRKIRLVTSFGVEIGRLIEKRIGRLRGAEEAIVMIRARNYGDLTELKGRDEDTTGLGGSLREERNITSSR